MGNLTSTDGASPEASPATTRGIVARKVTAYVLMGLLPKFFGTRSVLVGETQVYRWMSSLCADYTGGFWDYYEVSNGAFFMAPHDKGPMKLQWTLNGFEGEMSAQAAGLTATLFTLSHLSFDEDEAVGERFGDLFHLLRDFVLQHAESRSILAAID